MQPAVKRIKSLGPATHPSGTRRHYKLPGCMTSGVTLKRPQSPGHGVQPALKDDTVAWQTGTRGGNNGVASTNLDQSDDSHLLGGSCHDGLARPPATIGTQVGLRHNPARLTMGAGRGTIPSFFLTGPGWLRGNRTSWQTGTRGDNDGVASTNLDQSDDSHLLGGSCWQDLQQ